MAVEEAYDKGYLHGKQGGRARWESCREGRKEGGIEAEEGVQKPRLPPSLAAPLSLCEKALRISLACAHTREARAARVCAISSMQCGLPGFSDGLSFPLFPLLRLDSISPVL